MDVWAPEWARSKIGRSFVFEGFSPKNAGVLEATSLSGELIRASDTTPALRALVGAALGVEADALKTSDLTGHSLRHFLPEVATAAMWPDHLIDPLGPVGKQGEPRRIQAQDHGTLRSGAGNAFA